MAIPLNDLLANLAGAMKGLTLYPPGHPGITGPVGRFLELARPILLEKKELPLAIVEEVLTVAGVPFFRVSPAIDELAQRMRTHEIERIVFRFGLTPREVVVLVELLRSEPEALRPSGGIAAEAGRRQVRHIEFKAAVAGDEKSWERARVVYSDARGVVVGMMGELRAGRIPKAEKAVEILRTMDEILLKEPSALLCLTMLQDYDEYTFAHSVNVGILALALARAVGLGGGTLIEVGMAGMLHDVGKTRIAREILHKEGRLTEAEWDEIRRHPTFGAEIVQKMQGLSPFTAEAVLYHHAKFNLTGYPKHPDGVALNLGSRIVAIADTYDSMTTLRSYQRRHDPRDALEIMGRLVGRDLDPDYYRTFLGLVGIYPVGTLVRLDSGELAIVARANLNDPSRPAVRIVQGSDGKRLESPRGCATDELRAPGEYLRTIVETVDPMTQDPDLFKVLTQEPPP